MLLAAALMLPACSSTIADLPNPIGLPADAPARATNPPAYPAVHDMPPARNDVTLTEDEQKRIEGELRAARDRLQTRQGRKPQPAAADDTQPTGSNRNP
jgi:hypothetical protein